MTIIVLPWWSQARGNLVVPSSWQATQVQSLLSKARSRGSMQAFDKLTNSAGSAAEIGAQLDAAKCRGRRAVHAARPRPVDSGQAERADRDTTAIRLTWRSMMRTTTNALGRWRRASGY
jgi:hypothetical protein